MNTLLRWAAGLVVFCVVLRVVTWLVAPALPMLGVIGLLVLIGALVLRGPRSSGGLFHK